MNQSVFLYKILLVLFGYLNHQLYHQVLLLRMDL